MTAYFIILVGYLAVKGVECALEWLNMQYLREHGGAVPEPFIGHVEAADLSRMRDYTFAKYRIQLAGTAVDIVLTGLFFFGPFLDLYHNWLASYGFGPLIEAVLFFLMLMVAEFALKLPFDMYSTFQVEQKFGFNTQTPWLWVCDTLKTLAVSTVLYAILLIGIFFIIFHFATWWWLMGWLFLVFFSLFMLYFSPMVIEPIFNKFAPLESADLAERITNIMTRAGIAVSSVLVMDASRRSRHSNAYFSGIGRVKRIVLFDTLVKSNSDDEIIAILAHEAGHWKNRHVLKRLAVVELLALGGMYFAYSVAGTDILAGIFGITASSIHVNLLLAGFVGSLLLFPLKPLGSYFSRRHEWEADRFAVRLTGKPSALAQALIRLGRENLANLHPHPWYAAFYYSHPPLAERITRLLQ